MPLTESDKLNLREDILHATANGDTLLWLKSIYQGTETQGVVNEMVMNGIVWIDYDGDFAVIRRMEGK